MRLPTAAALAILLLLGACGSDDDSSTATTVTTLPPLLTTMSPDREADALATQACAAFGMPTGVAPKPARSHIEVIGEATAAAARAARLSSRWQMLYEAVDAYGPYLRMAQATGRYLDTEGDTSNVIERECRKTTP